MDRWRLVGRIADPPPPPSWWPEIVWPLVLLAILSPAAALVAALLKAEG